MSKTTEEQLKEREQERGLYCPNCEKKMPVKDSGFPGFALLNLLWNPCIYICAGCGYEHEPHKRKS